jgi:hypothetical protein
MLVWATNASHAVLVSSDVHDMCWNVHSNRGKDPAGELCCWNVHSNRVKFESQAASQTSRFLHEKITLRRPAHVLMSQRRGIWQVMKLHQFTRVPQKRLNCKHQLPTDWCSCKISGTEDKYFLVLVIRGWHLQKKWVTRVDPNSDHSDWGQVIRLGQAKWARAIGTRYRQVEWNTWNCANGFGCFWS